MEINKEVIKQVKITPLLDTLKLEDIDDSEYFSERYKNYISNSRLGRLVKEGAEAFFNNPPQEYNPSFETGSLIHCMTLEPDKYEVIDGVFKPSAKAGLMADKLYKVDGSTPSDDEIKAASYIVGYYKDKLSSNILLSFRQKAEPYWRDRFLYEQNHPTGDKKRIYTDIKNYELLCNCLNSLNNNEEIQKLLHPEGLIEEPIIGNERTILMDIQMELPEHETKIYKLKAKLDNFSIDKEDGVITVNDLKTTSKPASIFNPAYYSYQREIAGYSWLLGHCAKKFFDLEKFQTKGNFLVVSTVPEYNSCVYPMTNKLFTSGWKEYVFLLKTVYYLNVIKGYKFPNEV